MNKAYSFFLISLVLIITISTVTPASGILELEIFFNQTYGRARNHVYTSLLNFDTSAYFVWMRIKLFRNI